MRLALLLCVTAVTAFAQTQLTGWRQHFGDDPGYASPSFEDASWRTVPTLAHQSPGIVWHRLRLENTNPGSHLVIGPFASAYEVWVDGKLAGRFGEFSVTGWRVPRPMVFRLPSEVRTIAVRSGMGYGEGPAAEAWIGTQAFAEAKAAAEELARWQALHSMHFLCAALIVGSLLFLGTPLYGRSGPEYFWCGLYLLFGAGNRVALYFPEYLGIETQFAVHAVLFVIATPQTTILWSRFCLTLLGGRLGWPSWTCVAVTWAVFGGALATGLNPSLVGASYVMTNVVEVIAFVDILRSNRWRVLPELRTLTLMIGIFMATSVSFGVLTGLGLTALPTMSLLNLALRFPILLFMFAMGILLSQRSARLEREQIRLQHELAAAGEMQALLWPPRIPGIESVYLPAAEVGGDFYQVMEHADGSRLVLVGDVSGKGLRAAMLVSVAIGILRREASSSPAAILRALNNGLAGHTGGGFVTCCCARFAGDGSVTIANAGHPAPYCGGVEVDVPAGLPLGVLAGSEYEEVVFAGQDWAFVTDGVVEAANTAGELFGFERTREISTRSAAEIAEAARAWGQNDDITVVTVGRAA